MQTTDLTKTLSSYKSGWVAIDKKNKVVAHAKNYSEINKKVKKNKEILLVPASKNYFGFI